MRLSSWRLTRGALVFRFESDIPSLYLTRFAAFIPLIVATYVVAGYLARDVVHV
jgi:hypothetical protein